MARISKKATIEAVRETNELAVENKVEEVKEVKTDVKSQILADVKKVSINNNNMGLGNRVLYEEIEAILNKYM